MSAIRKERTEVLVGLFVFFGLAIMGALIVQFGRFSDRLRDKYRVEVIFPDASDIRLGSPVKLAGQKIGFVASEPVLNEDFTGVTVEIDVYSEKRIPQGSSFTIGTAGLMGDTYVRVALPEDPQPIYLEEGATVPGTASAGLDALQENADLLLADIREAVRDIRSAVQNLDRAFVKIEGSLLAEENIANLAGAFAEFRQSGENLNTASKKLDPLMDDARGAMDEAKAAMAKAGEAFEKAGEVIDKAGPAAEELQPTLSELRQAMSGAREAISRVTDGDGVAAALISDSAMRQDLESFIGKLESHGILGYPKDRSPRPRNPGAGAGAAEGGAAPPSAPQTGRGPLLPRKR